MGAISCVFVSLVACLLICQVTSFASNSIQLRSDQDFRMWRHSLFCLILFYNRSLAFIFSATKGNDQELHTNSIDYEAYHGEFENIGDVESDSVLMEQKTEDDFDDKVQGTYPCKFPTFIILDGEEQESGEISLFCGSKSIWKERSCDKFWG